MRKALQKQNRRRAFGRTKWQDHDFIKHNRYDRGPHYLHTPYLQGKLRKVRTLAQYLWGWNRDEAEIQAAIDRVERKS